MSRTRLLALLPVLAVLLLPATASALTTPDDVAAALRTDPVFVQPDAEAAGEVDADKVRAQIAGGDRRVLVVVLPARAAERLGSARSVAVRIAQSTGARSVILVALVGDELVAVAGDQTGFGPGQAQDVVSGVSGGATDRLVEAVRELQQVSVAATNGRGSETSGGDTADDGSSGLLVPLLVLGGLGGGAYLIARRQRRRQRDAKDMEGLRADVESLYNRLGSDVSTLAPGGDDLARQAMVDASERYNATGAILASADTPSEFAAARRTAVEGLIAARTARQRLGLDPGPEIPPPPGAGPQLAERQRVRVGDEEYEGSPEYEPGRGHYYGGGQVNGRMVPGGWYAFPFWETMLMTSVLTGGFGGGLFGGGGYERGYEEGVEDAGAAHEGGGWGSGGGGDFGGGDFGGGGGGGGDGW